MVRALLVALAFLLALNLSAYANVLCVQQTLDRLGYSAGTADGVLGARTQAAAAEFLAKSQLSLPKLDRETAGAWCEALRRKFAGEGYADAKSVNGIFGFDLDTKSRPKGVLSSKNLQALWNVHKTSRSCLEYKKAFGVPKTFSLPKLSDNAFASMQPQAVFPAAEPDLPACLPQGFQIARLNERVTVDAVPPPLRGFDAATVRNYALVYGADHPQEDIVDFAGAWFARHLSSYRANPSGPDARLLIDAMVEWAEAGAISRNIQIDGNRGPVVFAVSTLGSAIVNAYAELAPLMSPEEREVVGPWLHRFMSVVAASRDDFRTHNHQAGWSLMLATWGLATGNVDAVQHAVEYFKLAIHDMRPDGSFAADHSRGANGLSYNNLITGDLVLLAGLLKSTLDVDLFAYEVDGRSIHTAVEYVMGALADPVAANMKYALPCDAGDYMGRTRETPFVDYDPARERASFSLGAYLPAYALLFPDRPVSKQILSARPYGLAAAQFHPMWHAAPICAFGLKPDPALVAEVEVSKDGAPRVVAPQDAEKLAKVSAEPGYIDTAEVISHSGAADGWFDTLLVSKWKNAPKGLEVIEYNVKGSVGYPSGTLVSLQLIFGEPLGSSAPEGLAICEAGPHTVVFDDDKLHRLMVRLTPEPGTRVWSAKQAECYAKVLPKRIVSQMRTVLSSFQNIAGSLVNSGAIESITNDGLREVLRSIANGQLQVAASK
jgi:hypothetical protein